MRFPVITYFTISDFSLFNETIDFTIFPGLNMIIGGNGLGKTTLINTIIYGLVGNSGFFTSKSDMTTFIDKDYFKGKVEECKDKDKAKITLTFKIDNDEITVSRLLFNP